MAISEHNLIAHTDSQPKTSCYYSNLVWVGNQISEFLPPLGI